MCIPNSVPMRRMRSSISVRCIGSSPSVGSSRSTSSGSCAIADASLTRCRCPVDIVPTGRKRSSPSPTSQSASFARCDGRPAGEEVHLREVPDEIGRGELGGQVVVLRRVADPRPHLDPGSRRVLAEDEELARVARAKAEHEGDERRLAGAVRAEQARDAGADLRVEARERRRCRSASRPHARR